ncbi:hypothetical protein PF011_g32564 [Phytophthora fragariae]|uniref:Uncharacterized protein n=1 Tax=Phytophthora fragariae TaxID=53985 RepID=A0A6A3G5M7_9STRA|nr:hypothetical protein PF011_g32564 [Phytophthora fragariae]
MTFAGVSGSVTEAGGGVRAADGMLQLPSSKDSASRLVAASELEHGKLRLPSSKVRGVSGSVTEAGGGVRAADGNLPLPSRRFMTSEVAGRSWRY